MSNLVKKINSFAVKHPDIILAFLFGSVASGRDHSNSDVDVALLFERNKIPDGNNRLELMSELSGLLEQNADVVLLNSASPIVKMQVLRKGKKLYEKNRRAYSQFFVKTVNEYDDLKQVRKSAETKVLGLD